MEYIEVPNAKNTVSMIRKEVPCIPIPSNTIHTVVVEIEWISTPRVINCIGIFKIGTYSPCNMKLKK